MFMIIEEGSIYTNMIFDGFQYSEWIVFVINGK